MSLVCGSCTEREKASVETSSGVVGPEVARGSVPRQKTEGTEYQSRRPPADRLVVAEKPLLAGVVVERRGRLTRNVDSINRGSTPAELVSALFLTRTRPLVVGEGVRTGVGQFVVEACVDEAELSRVVMRINAPAARCRRCDGWVEPAGVLCRLAPGGAKLRDA